MESCRGSWANLGRRLASAFLVQLFTRGIVTPASALFGIGEQRFKYEGLIDMGALGMGSADGMVAAVGDLDGEQFLELFVLSSDQRSVSLYGWDRAAYTFRPVPDAQPIHAPFVITNIVPGDFDYDGRLDVLLMGEDNPGGWFSDDELKMVYYRGLGKGQFAQEVNIPSASQAQPMPFDAEGDMRVDLLGFPSGDKNHDNLKMWKNEWQATEGRELFTLADPPLEMSGFNCRFPTPHSNAFVDLDGDCLADLFLVCQDPSHLDKLSYQIWINAKGSDFRLAQTGPLPAGTGQISFADMDRDGTMDMVFPTCTSQGCFLNIAYNQQMPLCNTAGGLTASQAAQNTRCRDATNLCVADSQFAFDLSPEESNTAFARLPMSSLVADAPYLVLSDPSFRGSLPNPIRIGDFNKDGYPDLLIVSSSSSSARQGPVSLLQSIPCSRTSCSKAGNAAGKRTFAKISGGQANALNSIKDAKTATWIDIDEDGTLDILVQRVGKGSGASRQFTFIKNNYYHDAFFLKTLFGNGACEGRCAGPNGTRYNPYGVSFSGASYKFTVLDTAGVRKATQVGQLPQTGYLSMLTPYSYFGLGRTNNYVENLFVGSTRHQEEHFMSIEGVIPNSQVVVVPYQPEDIDDPRTWSRQLFLMPGRWIPWVGVTLIGSMIILATVVLVLHINEKAQDELERRRGMHLINFDAL